MAEAKKYMLTYAGLKKYESELEELVNVKRKEVAEKIKIARELGDLSENAEYDAAKEEQGHIESRIAELTALLKNAEVVSDDEVSADKITVGSFVRFVDTTNGKELAYKIVGSAETDILHGKMSNESPIGAALMGKTLGEVVSVSTAAGLKEYKIVEISRAE